MEQQKTNTEKALIYQTLLYESVTGTTYAKHEEKKTLIQFPSSQNNECQIERKGSQF